RAVAAVFASPPHLARNDHRAHVLHLHFEELLDSFLNLLLAGAVIDFEAERAFVFLEHESLFCNHGTLDDAVDRAHFVSTSCNAWIAAFVNTTCLALRTW